MTRDFDMDALVSAIERVWDVKVVSASQLAGHAHSINFRVETADGAFVAKCVPASHEKAIRRLLAHAAQVKVSGAPLVLFDGVPLDFAGWKVLALRWIAGSRRFPDELTEEEAANFLSAHAALVDGLSDDGEVLPMRDALALKRGLLSRLGRGGPARIVRELRLMDDASLTLPEDETRVIHGDLHHENFRFADGKVSGFLDVEELRFGTPAEDLVRYVVCRTEHLRWYELGVARRLLRVFREFVRRTPYSRRAWLFAIGGYLLRKLDKKIGADGRISALETLNLAFRFRFYRQMREIVCAERPAVRDGGRTVVKIFGGRVRRFMGGSSFDWEKYRFTCDPACRDYDWLCVYDEVPRGWPELERGRIRLRCPASHTMLLTQEPVSVKFYNDAYVRQFAVLLTNRPRSAENHPGYVKGEGYMVWFTGRSFAEERDHVPSEKTKCVSAVCSSKRMSHTEHGNRFRFMELARTQIPGFDWFGKGVRPIDEKYDALDAYKYHVAFENHLGEGHWTEKIADALVAGCLPFYAGDPKVSDALPADCFIPIPADNPERAVEIIRRAMADGEWERRRDAIAEARRRLLDRYNLFAQVAAAIESAPSAAPRPIVEGFVFSRLRTRLIPSAALSDLLHHLRRWCTSVSRLRTACLAGAVALLSCLSGCDRAADGTAGRRTPSEGERHLVRVCERARRSTPEDISGIARQGGDSYWGVCDSRSELCKLRLSVDARTGEVEDCECVELHRVQGGEDMEGLAFDPLRGSLWISDERGPRIFEYHPLERRRGDEVELPAELRNPAKNRALETVEISPDGLTLWTCNENALPDDAGHLADGREMVRLTRYSRASGENPWRMTGQWAYSPEMPGAGDGSVRNGVAALCALPDGELLVLEREKDTRDGLGFRARIFAVDVSKAADISGLGAGEVLKGSSDLVAKSVLFDEDTGKSMYEGLCLGPELEDGAQLLMLVSDGDGEARETVMTLRLAVGGSGGGVTNLVK